MGGISRYKYNYIYTLKVGWANLRGQGVVKNNKPSGLICYQPAQHSRSKRDRPDSKTSVHEEMISV